MAKKADKPVAATSGDEGGLDSFVVPPVGETPAMPPRAAGLPSQDGGAMEALFANYLDGEVAPNVARKGKSR